MKNSYCKYCFFLLNFLQTSLRHLIKHATLFSNSKLKHFGVLNIGIYGEVLALKIFHFSVEKTWILRIMEFSGSFLKKSLTYLTDNCKLTLKTLFFYICSVLMENDSLLMVFSNYSIYADKISRLKVFCKIGVLRNVAKLTQNHLCRSLFLIKSQASGLQLDLKVTPAQVFSCEFCENLRTPILQKICKQLLLYSVFITKSSFFLTSY